MFHGLSYQQSSQSQFISSDQPKLLSRFVIVDDHFIRNIIQHLTKIVDQLPHNPQFWKNSSWTQGFGKKAFFKGEKNPKTLPNFFCSFLIHIKNTFYKKNGSKRHFQASAVVGTIYRRLYGVTAAN